MMWVLLWIQLVSGKGVDYYQLSTHPSLEECNVASDKARVLISHQSEAVVCVEVNVK